MYEAFGPRDCSLAPHLLAREGAASWICATSQPDLMFPGRHPPCSHEITVPSRKNGRVRSLVVEDDPLLAEAVAEWLRKSAHAVDVVMDGDSAIERASVNDYDLVVLDRDLP